MNTQNDLQTAQNAVCTNTSWTWIGTAGHIQLWQCNACGYVTRDHLTVSGMLIYGPHYKPGCDPMAVGENLLAIPVKLDPTLPENTIKLGDVTFTGVKPDVPMPSLSSQMRDVLIALFDGDKPYNLYVDFYGEEGYKQFESDAKAWLAWLKNEQ